MSTSNQNLRQRSTAEKDHDALTEHKGSSSSSQSDLPMRFSMVRSFHLADLVTLGNGVVVDVWPLCLQ